MSTAHCSGKPRNLLKFFHDGENSLLKSLKETLVSPGCRVHRNSMVKSLHPCSFNSQAFSHPTFLKQAQIQNSYLSFEGVLGSKWERE
jgi:hypothetical protein